MRPIALVLAVSLLSGCVAYPRFYWTKKSGTVNTEGGAPIIRGAIVKECDRLEGVTEKTSRMRQARINDKGRYVLRVIGFAVHTHNFINGLGCKSRVQMFLCRDHCKEVDDLDIDVLGK